MPRSMTAYAKVKGNIQGKNLVLELYSVNKKGLDIQTYLPKEFLSIDIDLRKWVSRETHRGHVSLKIFFDSSREVEELFNPKLLKKVDDKLIELAKTLGFGENRPYSFPFLLEEAQKFAISDETLSRDELLKELEPTMMNAIAEWNEMKVKEGVFLIRDLEKRLKTISQIREKMVAKKDSGSDKLHKKLGLMLEEVEGKLSDEDRRRLLKEVVIYAEKLDITEELIRLEAHLEQFTTILHSDKVEVGKSLDFYVQEMLRESNTIASKACDLELIHSVIEIKGELEKIREQVQNIE